MKPELAGFDFEEAWQAAQEAEEMEDPEREARVLAAAEYAAAELSVGSGKDMTSTQVPGRGAMCAPLPGRIGGGRASSSCARRVIDRDAGTRGSKRISGT